MIEIFKIAGAILLSSGVAGAVLFGLSSFLGKIWANRLMISEKAKYENELEKLKADLQNENEKRISLIKNDLEIYKEKYLKEHKDKIEIYRLVTDIAADILGEFDIQSYKPDSKDFLISFDKFNRNRMRAYGYLAMFAPQQVMDAFDMLFDHMLLIAKGKKDYKWEEVRELALSLINEVRKDVGIDKAPIAYKGNL